MLATVHEDADVQEGWLEELVGALAADPRLRVVGPRLLNPDGSLQNQGWVMWSDGEHTPIDERADPGALDRTRPRPVDFVSSATMLFERQAWEEIGGFDERYHPAVFVEIDYCTAVWARGWTVASVPSARVVHRTGAMKVGSGVLHSDVFRGYISRRNRERYRDKWAARLAGQVDAGSRTWTERRTPELAARALELVAHRHEGAPVGSGPATDRGLTRAPGAEPPLDRTGPGRWAVRPSLGVRLLETEVATLAGFSEYAWGEVVREHAEVMRLRERDRVLERIFSGRWWRLRGVLRRFVPGWR